MTALFWLAILASASTAINTISGVIGKNLGDLDKIILRELPLRMALVKNYSSMDLALISIYYVRE